MSTSGPLYCGTAANDSGIGSTDWTGPTNAQGTDDASVATGSFSAGSPSHYLKCTNFGFSIPAGATIDGIQVEFYRDGLVGSAIDNAVRIVKGGSISTTDKSSVVNWANSISGLRRDSYGGSSELWGETWTSTDINASTFGVAISAKATGGPPDNAEIDSVRITITYTSGPYAASGGMRLGSNSGVAGQQGYNYCQQANNSFRGGGTASWTNTNNAENSDDGSLASVTLVSETSFYIKCTNFGFSIPASATIIGIKIEILRSCQNDAGTVVDSAVRIVKSGTIGSTDRSSATVWSGGSVLRRDTYGSSTDLWGETWVPDNLSGKLFGVAFSCQADSDIAYIDSVRATIYYSTLDGNFYIASGGLRLGGSASCFRVYRPSGNLVLSGFAGVLANNYHYTPTGNLVLGGTVAGVNSYIYTASGGMQFGNGNGYASPYLSIGNLRFGQTVTTAFVVYGRASGGPVFGGSATVVQSKGFTYFAIGPVRFGLNATSDKVFVHPTVGGKANLNGHADAKPVHRYLAAGNVKFGGTALVKPKYKWLASGNAKFGGTASTHGIIRYRASGKANLGGTVGLKVRYIYNASGKTNLGGSSRAIIVFRPYAASGNVKFGGSSRVQLRFKYLPVGGKVNLAGTARSIIKHKLYAGNGHLVVAGTSRYILSKRYTASGECQLGGSASYTKSKYLYLASGGLLKLNGNSSSSATFTAAERKHKKSTFCEKKCKTKRVQAFIY